MRGGLVFYKHSVAENILSDPLYGNAVDTFWPALESFEGSVHVIIGTCDYVDLGPSVWPRVIKHMKDGHINIIENAGHSSWKSKPQEFNETLKKVLS